MRHPMLQKSLSVLMSMALVLELVPAQALAEEVDTIDPPDQVEQVVSTDDAADDVTSGDQGTGADDQNGLDADDQEINDSESADAQPEATAVPEEQEGGAELTSQVDGTEIRLMDSIGVSTNLALNTNERYTIVGGPDGWKNASPTVTFTPVDGGTRQSHEGAYAVATDPKDHTVLNGLTYEENGKYWSLPEGRYTMTLDVNGAPYTTDDLYTIGYDSFTPILFNSYFGTMHADDFVVKDRETGDRLTTVDTSIDVELDFVIDSATELAYDGRTPRLVSITLLKTDASAETLAQQMATGDFTSWPTQTTWFDFTAGAGLKDETTIYPVIEMQTDLEVSYFTTPPSKHAEVKIGRTNFGYAADHGSYAYPDKYRELTSGQYFPVARWEIDDEVYIFAYNPITVVATQPTDAKAPTITTATLPSTMVNGTYTTTLAGKTGSPDGKAGQMSWSITEGALPEGLVLDGDKGKITGIPTTSGTYPVTVTLTEVLDGEARTASRVFTIRVLDEVAVGDIYYDQSPIWADGTQQSIEVSATVLGSLADPELNLSGTKAWVLMRQSKDGTSLQDIWQPLTISDGKAEGSATLQADATAIDSITVKLELRNDNGAIIYRSTPDGQEPFEVTATVENPNIPFGGQVSFPKLELKSAETPITSARVRVWPAGEAPTDENTYTYYIDIRDGIESMPLAEGSYVFVVEASVGHQDGWVDIMGSSETGKLVAGTNPKQYQFSVVRGKTTKIDAIFSAEKIAYHNAAPLFEDESGDFQSGLCGSYNVEWYRRTGGKDILVGTGDTVVLSQTSDPVFVKVAPDGRYAATWDASPLVEVKSKVVTVEVPRRPHFSVEATLAFASGWDASSWRLGVIEVAKPCGDGEYTTHNTWIYDNPITLDDITPGTVLTYTPADESMCGPVSYTIKNAKDTKVTLTAPHARGIVSFEGLTLLKANDVNSKSDDEASARTEPIALDYGDTRVQVTKSTGDGKKPVKFYIADDSRLRILDDEASLVPGAQYNVTVSVNDYNGTYYPFCSINDRYAARETYTVTLADNGDYLASATVAPEQPLATRGACVVNLVKHSDNSVDLLIYDGSDNLVAGGWWGSNGDFRRRTPFLDAGSYKLYAVDSKAIKYDGSDATKTVAGLVGMVGTDESIVKKVDFTIKDNEMGALSKDFVLPVGSSAGLIDSANSMVTAEGSYGDSMTIRLHAEVLAAELVQDDAYIEFYTNQPSDLSEDGYTNPQALAINGKAIAIDRWNNLFDGTQNMYRGTLRVRLSEAKKYNEACAKFPMDMTLVIPRVDTDKTEVWAWLVTGDHRSLIGYYDEIPEDVSLTAPITVAWKTFSVHGMARLNADVDICIDGMRVAQTRADEYGFFTTEVTLPDDVEDGDEFAMTATSTWLQGGSEHTATSEAQDVTYSTTEAAVERITMFYQDSVNGSYHAVKLYDRGALSSKYLGIYRPGYEDASNQMHYVFMAEIVNPQCATDVTINVVRSDGDLELETKSTHTSVASVIPDVQHTIELRSGLQAMASYTGSVQRNAAGDVIVDALDRGTAFVTDPVILSYAPEEVYVTFDDVLTEPETVDLYDTYPGFISEGITEEGLAGALTAINTSDNLKIVNAQDGADGNMDLVDSAAAAKEYLANADGTIDDWMAISLGEDEGWLKVHHTTNITEESSSEATRAISAVTAANQNYLKQLKDGNLKPNVTYNGKKVSAISMGYDNDPSNVYFIETIDGAGSNVDMMYQYSIGTTGRSLYTRITADHSGYTRKDWDESTGKCTTMTYTIDPSQLPDSMDLVDMPSMWAWIHNSVTLGYEDAAESLGMDEEEIEDLLGLEPQSMEAQGTPKIPKSKDVKQKVWDALGYRTELDGMTDEEINFILAYIREGADTSDAADNKSMWWYYAEQESNGKRNAIKELKAAWCTTMLKKVTETVVEKKSLPDKKAMTKAALNNLHKAYKARNKGPKEVTPAFRRVIKKLKKDQKDGEERGFHFPELPDLPPEKPKKPKKSKTPSKPKTNPAKPKTKTRGKNANKTNAKRNAGKGAKIKWDPSGIVYEAVLSNPVEGATVQLYTINATNKVATFVDSTKFGVEPNPQTTGADGHYEWYVPEGFWQVRASKEGYTSFSTGNTDTGANYGINATRDLDGDGVDDTTEYWMPVLPIQLDVNLPLVSYEKPTVKATEGDETGVVVEFSKYMKPETVTADLFTVAGKAPSKVEAVDAEAAGDGSDATYARAFKLVYASDVVLKQGKNTVKVTMTDSAGKAKSYAGSSVDKLPYNGEVEVTIGGMQDMYRLYNPNSGEHFYTASAKERDDVVKAGWQYEGVGWVAPATGDPVYRLYNAVGGEHHYTTDASERDMLVGYGWNDEGIGWYSDPGKKVPLYREYNPNAFACNHNYTTSKSEHDTLVGLGWKDEGYAWYGVAEGRPA